ncbi:hypothetical protein D3C81_1798860 [compost metagenome]
MCAKPAPPLVKRASTTSGVPFDEGAYRFRLPVILMYCWESITPGDSEKRRSRRRVSVPLRTL